MLSSYIERKSGRSVVLSWFSGPFFRAVFPDHRAPTFLPWPFDIKRRKPLSSYRVKRLFSNLLADIGFITFPRLSLSAAFLSMLFHPVFSQRCFLRFSLIFIVAVPLLPRKNQPPTLLFDRVMAWKWLNHSIVFFASHSRSWDTKLREYRAATPLPEETGYSSFYSSNPQPVLLEEGMFMKLNLLPCIWFDLWTNFLDL